MAYEVTARRWRPQEFERVIGQDHVTSLHGIAPIGVDHPPSALLVPSQLVHLGLQAGVLVEAVVLGDPSAPVRTVVAGIVDEMDV